MTTFTIRDIENLTGIRAHTLRIWEQRYDFFRPKRKESRHRFYDNEDLKQLLRVSFLYHNGMKISRIASLSDTAISEAIRNTKVADDKVLIYATRLLEAAVDFDETAFHAVLDEVIDKTGFEKCIVEVCYPYLQKIGLLWSTNNIIPAQEHFSSYLVQNRIILETEKQRNFSSTPNIILACPQGEFHELPLLFINYLLRKHGWATVFLGTNVKTEDIAAVAGMEGIRYIYLHLLTNFTGMFADDYFEAVCRQFPDKQIMASGEGTRTVQRSFVNLQILRNDEAIYEFVRNARISAEHGS